MIKKVLVAIIIQLTFMEVHTQTISFEKKVFKAGEDVKVTVSGDLTGIENGITNSSYVGQPGLLNLGRPSKVGFYRIDFFFKDLSVRSYLIGVVGASDQTSEDYVIPLTQGKMSSIPAGTGAKILQYFQTEVTGNNLLVIAKQGLNKFCKENAVGIVSNVSFCISTISGVPVVFAICESLTVSNTKKLAIEVFKSFLSDMLVKKYLTKEEYDLAIVATDASQVGAILKSNCSLIFKSLKKLSDNPDLKLALGYFEQQCKTTVLIIEKFEVTP